MEKSTGAFRTISEVSLELDVPQHVLRFWEQKFTQESCQKFSQDFPIPTKPRPTLHIFHNYIVEALNSLGIALPRKSASCRPIPMAEKGVSKPGPAPGDRTVLGITLGNSNSSIAYTVDDKAEVIANEDGGEKDWRPMCTCYLLIYAPPIYRSPDPHDIILCRRR